MLDAKLKELLDFAKSTDLQEVEWEKNGEKISFRRSAIQPAPRRAAGSKGEEPEAPAAQEALYIRSTMVGTFFRSESPDRPPLVVEGTLVGTGQSVASIEAMKIRKDVVAQMDCRIIKSLVTDGHSVEYGQPLFEVEPTNGSDHV